MHLTIGLVVGLLLSIPILYGIMVVLTISWVVFDIIHEGFWDKIEHESIECKEPSDQLIEKVYYYPFKLRMIITKDQRLYVCYKKGCMEFV